MSSKMLIKVAKSQKVFYHRKKCVFLLFLLSIWIKFVCFIFFLLHEVKLRTSKSVSTCDSIWNFLMILESFESFSMCWIFTMRGKLVRGSISKGLVLTMLKYVPAALHTRVWSQRNSRNKLIFWSDTVETSWLIYKTSYWFHEDFASYIGL